VNDMNFEPNEFLLNASSSVPDFYTWLGSVHDAILCDVKLVLPWRILKSDSQAAPTCIYGSTVVSLFMQIEALNNQEVHQRTTAWEFVGVNALSLLIDDTAFSGSFVDSFILTRNSPELFHFQLRFQRSSNSQTKIPQGSIDFDFSSATVLSRLEPIQEL
jgi:hypothetical protein